MSLNKNFFCTIGPTSLNQRTICRLDELGVALFRINLSHTKLEDLEGCIDYIRKYSDVPICLDTEGAQIRTGYLSSEKKLIKENEELNIDDGTTNNPDNISLYPPLVLDELVEGDLLDIDFSSSLIQIIFAENRNIKARVVSSGWIGRNKAVTLFRPIHLPALTQKDMKAIEIGKEKGIKNYALSFANCGKDVEELRKIIPSDSQIISKIESRSGYKHLDDILKASDAILIDRGDLSREIPAEMIPFYQKKIIERANKAKIPVHVATNLLESMIENPYPTRAEVNDVINVLASGADGLVLAGETAIGKRPVETATMVVKLIKQFELSCKGDIVENPAHANSSLVEPHGGLLIDRWEKEPDWDSIKKLKQLVVSDTVIMDAQQIGIGTYSPLEGFMKRDEIHSVLDSYKLSGGVVWTLPIVLQKNKGELSGIKKGKTIALVSEVDSEIYALLEVEDVYKFPFEEICQKWFGTLSTDHPGVKILKTSGDCFVGGKVTLLKNRKASSMIYEFRPEELRRIFDIKGWSRVVGFHTRNAVHRGHEAIQKIALEKMHCDGLLVSPVIGRKKKGDFVSEVLLNAYQLMIDKGFFHENKVFIGAFSTYSRYSGAREAIFTALCRKNFGCSHFIVGRDHTGVGNFYAPDSSRKLFESLGDIGIKPVFFDEIKYCSSCNDYVSNCEHGDSDRHSISGTKVREFLSEKKLPPDWVMRPEISKMIIDYKNKGKEIFVL